MEINSDLQVDVNGQHIFWANKEIYAQFSSKLSNIFEKRCKNGGKEMKVIFQDFPGGPAGFELITRFFYNNGAIDITHSNVLFLHHVARYLEMNKVVFGRPSLMDRTEKFLEGVDLWDWSELLLALTDGQRLLIDINPVSSVRMLVGEVVERLASRCLTTPSSLSSKCSSFRSSCDSKSTLSNKSGYFRMFWWFEDLSTTLNIDLIELLVKKMVLEKFDHLTISKFIFYYQRVRVLRVTNIVVRAKIVEKLINLLSLLDKRIISIKGLFETLRIASNLKLTQPHKSKLEILIGLQLDQATLDDLLLPFPLRKTKKCTMYNVNIVLRFLKNFLLDGNISHHKLCSYRLKRVARLVDSYASEIAPDHRLKPSMFVALTMVIPDSARDSCDKIYQAIEIFLEVHPKLNEEQKTQICAALNYNKLSPQVLNRLSRNNSFPLLAIVQAVIHQNPTLKRSVKDTNHLKVFRNLSCRGHEAKSFATRDEVLVKELANNEKFRVHLQEMGWTVVELENIFGKLQSHYVTNAMTTPKVCCVHNVKHLPKLCS
ncbi:BTB/POZ domain-containing protein At3g22104-like [Chenopodium quinoa]|uniref:BTB/POZ domain-containing protein At3g22104-like n=1 Tax=Chenopodium quinoa TaxID=63459 RepID=UPI000B782F87|nr:BTB/POZ domain-containing protein At3g22104-like [Chenopodium quinoa]